jgi:anti-sigma regulatory factor (Ser/Thr protein kinase)
MSDAVGGRAAITCAGRLESLAPLLAFVDRACADAGLAGEDAFAVRLAVEEVCTNIITHGYGGGAAEPVSLAASRRPDALVVTVEDRAPLFDPADAPEPDLAADWSARPIGGVGWHLVRELMDEVHHEPAGEGGNRVTLVKYLPDRSGTTKD